MRQVMASATGLLALLMAGPVVAQEARQAEREQQHVVRQGDTLWDLAGRYLGNPNQWPRLHAENTSVVADPHRIFPEMVLAIPGLAQRGAILPAASADAPARARADAPADAPAGAPADAPADARADAPVAAPLPASPGTGDRDRSAEVAPARSVFYAAAGGHQVPDRPTVLTEPVAERVPVRQGEFLSAEFLAPGGALPVVGQVVQAVRATDSDVDLETTAHPRDDLYVSHTRPARPTVGEVFLVAEVGRLVPAAGRDVRMVEPRAVVRVVDASTQVIRVNIEQQFGRVLPDHVLLPLELYPDFRVPEAPPVVGPPDLTGRILEFVDAGLLPGRMARAFIDLGRGAGVQVGDVFEGYLPVRRSAERDAFGRTGGELLPEEPIARLRVVRVTDHGATVIVDELTKPELGDGLPVRRIRKMP